MATKPSLEVIPNKVCTEIPEDTLQKCNEDYSLDLSRNPGIQLNDILPKLLHIKKLWLGDCGLQGLPDALFLLVELEELNLSNSRMFDAVWNNNFVAGINPRINELTQLRKLSLCRCHIRALPDEIGDLKSLEKLVLRGNNLLSGLNDNVGRLSQLKKLDLQFSDIPRIPDCIGNLKKLEVLVIAENMLEEGINPAIKQLPLLKKLDITGASASSGVDIFLEGIQDNEFHKLEEFLLRGNVVPERVIPKVCKIVHLKKLDLHMCSLRTLPDNIGTLKQLEELLLNENDFSDDPTHVIKRLAGLRTLHLGHCKFINIENIGNLTQLEELKLGGLCAGVLSAGIGRLCVRLKKLDLRDCNLTTLTDSFGDLKQLEVLCLQHNDFSAGLAPAVGRLERLRELSLSNCKLTTLTENFGDLKQLETLDLSRNNFSGRLGRELGQLHQLKRLDLSSCNIETINSNFKYLKQLQELNLSGNNFAGGISSAIGEMVELRVLDVSACNLTTLAEQVGDLKHLFDLNVSNNQLTEYPRCTLPLKSLWFLNLSRDKPTADRGITQLPVALAHVSLKRLDIDGNPITHPPSEIWTRGIKAIRSFMLGLIPGGKLWHADTLNLIGNTGAGKTSLAKSLEAGSPRLTAEPDRTPVLEQLQAKTDDSAHQCVTINDFGGHQMYHSVIPIFFTTNGLNLIVINLAEQSPEKTLKEWLLTLISKCREIRVIVVGTHTDKFYSCEELSTLNDKMCKCILKVFQEAIEEVNYHITSFPTGSFASSKKLPQLLASLRNASHNFAQVSISKVSSLNQDESHLGRIFANQQADSTANSAGKIQRGETALFITLSCLSADDLSTAYNLVVQMIRPPEQFPLTWYNIMNDLRNINVLSLYITMQQVKDICNVHCSECDDNTAATILGYLAKTSMIIWLENHPKLKEYIFHSPQKIIDVCKTVLHHDGVISAKSECYKDDLEKFSKGYLSESLLMRLLSEHSQNLTATDAHAIPPTGVSCPYDVVIELLQNFNLIGSISDEPSRGRTFIVPCKLESVAPVRLHELENKGSTCKNRVIVRLSFTGKIIPLSLFERSLAAMVSVANTLADKQRVCPDIWKDGIIIEHNEVYFISQMRESVISFTAFSEENKPSPWTILTEIIRCIHENMESWWHGAPPRCAIVCPYCMWRHQQSDLEQNIGKIETDLQNLRKFENIKADPQCGTCRKFIPKSLCFPTEYNGSAICEELQKFFGGDAHKQQVGATTKFSFDSTNISDAVLVEKRTLASCNIAGCLTDGELNVILRKLHTTDPPCIISIEKEDIEGESGPTRRAAKLLDTLQKKSANVVRTFEKILREIGRTDIAESLRLS